MFVVLPSGSAANLFDRPSEGGITNFTEGMKMRKLIMGVLLVSGLSVFAGSVSTPMEIMALPVIETGGSYLICVWDVDGESWMQEHVMYDNSGSYELQIPEWEKWYWVGLWDSTNQRYVFGKWMGHFKTD